MTDYKPLLALLSEQRATSLQASARVRRWSQILSTYEYSIMFRKIEEHGNADALSRLPLPIVSKKTKTPREQVLLIENLTDSSITALQICSLTRRDPFLTHVVDCLQRRWSTQSDPTLAPLLSWKSELSLHIKCCIL